MGMGTTSETWWCLETAAGGYRLIPLKGERASVGRSNSNDICIVDDMAVSRDHAFFVRHESGWFIEDRGSTNGVWVNGSREWRSKLQPDDLVSIGTTRFRFRAGGREIESEALAYPVHIQTGPITRDAVPRVREWDLFISHASEDKPYVVDALAHRLRELGLLVWYDDFELKVGDRLRQSIESGLARSRYGLVVLSYAFFAKHWPRLELDALAQREEDGAKVILPLWFGISSDDVKVHSPLLADRVAVKWSYGLTEVANTLVRVIAPERAVAPVVDGAGEQTVLRTTGEPGP